MGKKQKTAITPTREENYPEWYQQVIKASDMAERAPVRGCMVIKPWGYALWENIVAQMDRMFKATGVKNAYFPLFIPINFLEQEAEHVEGFAKECAVVTHHRLEEGPDGGLVPAGKLVPEVTVRSIVQGVLWSIVFSAAATYLALKLGQGIESAIPISILAVGFSALIVRTLQARASTLLENVNIHGSRAVQVYLWSLPIVGQAQWRQSYLDLYDMKPNQMVYLTQFNDRSLILTANESTPYLIGWTNVKDKATVVEIPAAAVIGLGIDFWQRGLADFGMFGPFAGNGGTWVITGPETPQSEIPYIEGAKFIELQTNNVWLVSRLSMPADEREQVVSGFKLYYSGETPRAATIIPSDNKPGRNYQPRGMKYWEMLHAILQEEPVEERDRFFMYFLKELGIQKGKPFNPDEYQQKILTDAVLVGEAMAKNMVFRERLAGVLG